MNTDILKLLENDARLTPAQIAVMLDLDVETVKKEKQLSDTSAEDGIDGIRRLLESKRNGNK